MVTLHTTVVASAMSGTADVDSHSCRALIKHRVELQGSCPYINQSQSQHPTQHPLLSLPTMDWLPLSRGRSRGDNLKRCKCGELMHPDAAIWGRGQVAMLGWRWGTLRVRRPTAPGDWRQVRPSGVRRQMKARQYVVDQS